MSEKTKTVTMANLSGTEVATEHGDNRVVDSIIINGESPGGKPLKIRIVMWHNFDIGELSRALWRVVRNMEERATYARAGMKEPPR
jgi:hypothetical protein